MIACYVKTGDASKTAQALRQAAPYALPNTHILGIADELLGCHGALLAAREEMGPATVRVSEAPLTTLRLFTS